MVWWPVADLARRVFGPEFVRWIKTHPARRGKGEGGRGKVATENYKPPHEH